MSETAVISEPKKRTRKRLNKGDGPKVEVLNYVYGARVDDPMMAKIIRDQIHGGHRFLNKMIELNLKRQATMVQLRIQLFPELQELEQQMTKVKADLEALEAEIRKNNARARSRKTITPEQRQQQAGLRKQRKEIGEKLKDCRQRCNKDPEMLRVFSNLDKQYKKDMSELRKSGMCFWGTYLAAEERMQQMLKDQKTNPLTFRRWSGRGTMALQIQHGMTPEEAFSGKDSRLRLQVTQELPRGRKYVDVMMRIGSKPKSREPVWAKFSIKMHRPFPGNCHIMWVKLIRKPAADRDYWELIFSVRSKDSTGLIRSKPAAATSGIAAIDYGWRQVPEGIRVGTLWDDQGHHEFLILPQRFIDRVTKLDSLKSIRDLNMDKVKIKLHEWFEQRKAQGIDYPVWMNDVLEPKYLPQIKSQTRLRRFVAAWREQRFAGDEQIMEMLLAWYEQDIHLWQWFSCQSRRVLFERREIYRLFASRLRRKYQHVIIEAIDWRELAKNPSVENTEHKIKQAEYNRRVACVSDLTQALLDAGPARTNMFAVLANNTTKICHACGTINNFDAAAELNHVCHNCQTPWDQDINAARNILDSYLAAPEEQRFPVTDYVKKAKALQQQLVNEIREDCDGDAQV